MVNIHEKVTKIRHQILVKSALLVYTNIIKDHFVVLTFVSERNLCFLSVKR